MDIRNAATAALGSLLFLIITAPGCSSGQWQPAPCPSCEHLRFPSQYELAEDARHALIEPTVEEAEDFMAATEAQLKRLYIKRERAAWVQYNFITGDTQAISAEAEQETMAFLSQAIKQATRFDGLELDAELARKLKRLKLTSVLPAPQSPALSQELASITSWMQAAYGKGKHCPAPDGALRQELLSNKAVVEALDEAELTKALKCSPQSGGAPVDMLSTVLQKSRNEPALREAWLGWRTISPPMRPKFARYVELGNQGAREIGFADLGELWRSGYDLPADDFRQETERLWQQVKPLYEELHCFVRARLRQQYGDAVVPKGGPIPAHLLGNMWAQQWGHLYELLDLLKGQEKLNVTQRLTAKGYDEEQLVRLAERFFTSLGFDPLPPSFYERSLFKKPADREVLCHASAWDVTFSGDLRIKMCIKIGEEDLNVIHHELGHNYYYHYYKDLPILFHEAANDGFHEAIGDVIALSITPAYLQQVGLIDKVVRSDEADISFLLKMALDKIAFLPFGKLIDQYRWDVFAGAVAPADYNQHWWKLRRQYQGIAPPLPRSEQDFDPGAKYHVPANVPYMRYFLAHIYQFQFQRALCRAAGHTGPLHRCSIYGSQQAGEKLKALLRLGASRPWQEALAALSGERAADADALVQYFAPLRGWLKQQIKGETCGW